jgi:purine-binding chemotaxis protein CheW
MTTMTTPGVLEAGGLVTFRLGQREYATALGTVREVVRLQGLADLPGMRPPLAGVLDLRGTALPVLDLRSAGSTRGDVLVLETTPDDAGLGGDVTDAGAVGVAVDQVHAVVRTDDLVRAGRAGDGGVLPDYVLEVLRSGDGVVFLVDLRAMVASV